MEHMNDVCASSLDYFSMASDPENTSDFFQRRPVDQLTTIMDWVLVFTSLLSSKCSCESAQMHLCFSHIQNMNVYNEKLRTTNGWISEHGRLMEAFAHMR